MVAKRGIWLAWAAVVVGCAAPRSDDPMKVQMAPPTATASTPPTVLQVKHETPLIALVEPYLVSTSPEQMILPPPSLGGRIQMPTPTTEPLAPSSPPDLETRPLPTSPAPTIAPPAAKPSTKPSGPLVSAMVRLLEEERSRSVDQARRQLSLATTHVSQTASEAKKTADLVRAGAVAQFKSTQADAAARDAVSEQSEAQKNLDDAQQRVREARRDVESTLNAVSEVPLSLISLTKPTPAFRPMPFTYRLSILGPSAIETVKIEGGTLGRALERGSGEAGAWIVRCQDPSKLRVIIGETETQTILRSLPRTGPAPVKA